MNPAGLRAVLFDFSTTLFHLDTGERLLAPVQSQLRPPLRPDEQAALRARLDAVLAGGGWRRARSRRPGGRDGAVVRGGCRKPDPQIFFTACDRLRVRPEDTVMIGEEDGGIRWTAGHYLEVDRRAPEQRPDGLLAALTAASDRPRSPNPAVGEVAVDLPERHELELDPEYRQRGSVLLSALDFPDRLTRVFERDNEGILMRFT